MSEEITFICFFHGSANSSQCAAVWGEACRLILNRTVSSVMVSIPLRHYVATSYLLGLGGIRLVSTGSNSNLGSSASGAKEALVVFSQFLSSRSGNSGL